MIDGMSGEVYRSLFELSRGGMGRVDLGVRQEGSFRRLCALKRVRDDEEPELEAMLREEARLAGLVRHPNVVPVLDVARDREGLFLVMEYIEGVSVGELLSRAATSDTPLHLLLCVRVAMEAARGLHAAHELRNAEGQLLGLVHRDISPSNLLVGCDGVTRVTDFGIAKAQSERRRDHTRAGVLKGKMGYMAPERLRFLPQDRRGDLFGLGVVLWEMLAGRRLYGGDQEHEVAQRILNEPAPDVAFERNGVPDDVVELLFQLLAKVPNLRPATGAVVAETLERVERNLALRMGAFDVADHVQTTFAHELQTRRDRTSQELQRLSDKTSTSRTLRMNRRVWRWRGVTAAALALAGLAGGSVWLVGAAARAPQDITGTRQAPVPVPAPVVEPTHPTAAPPSLDVQQLPRPVTRRGLRTKSRSGEPAPATRADCDNPFEFDAQGRKRVKRDCF